MLKRSGIGVELAVGLLLLIIGSVGNARPVSAAVFVVTNTNDAGPGSLRQAITDANNNGAAADTIDATGVTGTITLTTGQLLVSSALIINGSGANLLTVSGNNASTVFRVGFNLTGVTFNNLTIANGNNPSNGGGVVGFSPTTFNDVAIVNSTSGTAINVGAGGGAIFASQPLVMNRVTLSGNQGLGGASGGAIYLNQTTAALNNVTISGNQAAATTPSAATGGGIFAAASTLDLNNVTITNNVAGSGGGGGIRLLTNSTANVRNSIIAGNTSAAQGPDCFIEAPNVFNSLGYNVIGSTANCAISGTTAGNKAGVSALLGPLANNGGPTQTHALQPGSPAVDAGDPAGCSGSGGLLMTDQRGQPRPFDGDGNGVAVCDAGAYEAQAILAVSAPTATKSFNPAIVDVNGVTTLSINLTNTSAAPLTGVAISDTFPPGLRVAMSPNPTNTCGGTFAPTANQTSISLTGGSIGANGTCSISVQVQATSSGSIVNTTGPVTSAQTPGGAATGNAALQVNAATPSATVTPTTPTAAPTVTPTPVVAAPRPIAPQVFQNPAALQAIFAGSGPNSRPQQGPLTSAASSPSPVPSSPPQTLAVTNPPLLRPPSTGDAGLALP